MIVICGEALMDMVPEGKGGKAFIACPGGSPYNTAIAAARLGSKVAFLGRIGEDFFGDELEARLRSNGVDTSLIARRSEPTTLAFVKRGSGGDARYAFYSNGAADRSLAPEDLPPEFGREVRFLVAGSISLLQEPAAATIEALITKEAGRVLVSVDPNLRPSLVRDRETYRARLLRVLSLAAVVKASEEDLEWIFPDDRPADRLSRLLEAGVELVVETKGKEGALARTKKVEVEMPAFEVTVADTIGAGDTFHAALLHRLDGAKISKRAELAALSEASLREIVKFAEAAAALCCTRTGAEPPTSGELESFLSAR